MRVIAGKAKGIKLHSKLDNSTRPIMNRVKESLFSTIQHELEDANIIDLFAGSGSIGIEALSRGAGFAIFIDQNKQACQTIQANLDKCKFSAQGQVRQTDVFSFLRKTSKCFDFIFLDPPQDNNLGYEILSLISERPNLFSPQSKIILKISPYEYEEFNSNTLVETKKKKFGSSQLLLFFEPKTT